MSELVDPPHLRPARYVTLFQGELPYDPLPDDTRVGISSLCRITPRSGGRSDELRHHLENVHFAVSTVLLSHDLAARDAAGEAIFGFIDGETRTLVSAIVADVFSQWEITHSRRRLGPLLPSADSPARWLVVETAAAVVAAGTKENSFDLQKNKTDGKNLAKILSCWGPEFIRQWFDGTLLNQWADKQRLTSRERVEWLAFFTPGIRKHFAIRNVSDPLRALEVAKFHFEVTLADANVAEFLGWTETEVAEFFTPGLRKHFAVNYVTDPLRALATVKSHLEVTLSDTSVAEFLDWTEAEVAEFFGPGIRKHFAIRNISDPLRALAIVKSHLEVTLSDANIAERLGWTEADAADFFTISLRKYFAVNNITDPLAACRGWADGTISRGYDKDTARNNNLAKLSG